MKKQLFLLFAILQALGLYAQQETEGYRPFIEDGKVWTVGKFEKGVTEPIEIREYRFDGDTIIQDKVCRKWMCRKTVNGSMQEEAMVAPLYEEDRKVYFYRRGERFCLYDFSLEENGVLSLCRAGDDYESSVVGHNDYETPCNRCFSESYPIRGTHRRIFCFQDDWLEHAARYDFYMEGVGSIYAPDICFHTNHPGFSYELMECKVNDEIIYTRDDSPAVFVDSAATADTHVNDIEYRPFIEENKQWIVTLSTGHGYMPVYGVNTYFFDGDSIVHGQTCKKMMCRAERFNEGKVSTNLVFPVYEKERKVYYFRPDSDEPIMLYDFNACYGDTVRMSLRIRESSPDVHSFLIWDALSFKAGEQLYLKYRPIGTFLIPLKGYQASSLPNHEIIEGAEFVCIEGIGSFYNPIEKTDLCYGSGPAWLLRECKVGEKVLYANYIDGDLSVRFPSAGLSTSTIPYDLQGRPVSGTQKGILIRSGKKVLVK